MPQYRVIKTFVIRAEDMDEAKEKAKDLKDHQILEIYKEEDQDGI